MGKKWKDIDELFSALNQNCNYLILRNFEEIKQPGFVTGRHPDIDILCDDFTRFKNCIHPVANPFYYHPYRHYWVNIDCYKIKIGIRSIGNFYYDPKWEQDMLANRVFHPDGFYTPDAENYLYSLLYHALLQKPCIAEDYLLRFKDMGCDAQSTDELLTVLYRYMRKKKYHVTCPKDITIPMQLDRVPDNLLLGKRSWEIRKKMKYPERVCRYLARRILKK
ncbi:MAG: hypothetical protein LIO86_13460 [Lachnospiraceae bacterium]|nr:hypothetical protein [Lachnospiraceae bacterium]